MQKSKMAVWGGLTNSCEKNRSKKQKSEKAYLKLNIQKTKIIAFGPITSWQIEREKVDRMTDFNIFMGSKITVDTDCSHEIKRHLLLERKAMTNL